MGFTFVTGCLPCSRLLPTPPHGNAVTGHSPLNDVIGGDVVFIRGLWFSGARRKMIRLAAARTPPWSRRSLGSGCGPRVPRRRRLDFFRSSSYAEYPIATEWLAGLL